MAGHRSSIGTVGAVVACLAAAAVAAQAPVWRETNAFGVPGLVEMPDARAQPDGEITFAAHAFDNGTWRTAVGFQLAPRVHGTFRYASVDKIASGGERTFDRSFDLRLQVLREGARTPAVTVGLQDLGGTGVYASEYVVATKAFGPVAVTAGLGWGRLATRDGFDNPLGALDDRFETRPGIRGVGGDFSSAQWFRGPAALFGGVAWRATDRLTLAAEYASDAYVRETRAGIVDLRSPINVGLHWAATENLRVSAALRGGDAAGVGFTYALNPRRSPLGSGIEPAPLPVLLRPDPEEAPAAWSTAWSRSETARPAVVDGLARALDAVGLELQSHRLTGDAAEVRFFNRTYESQAQAIGRAARALTHAMPPSVRRFTLVPVNAAGQAGAAVTLARADVEAIENRPNGATEILAAARIDDAASLPGGREAAAGLYPDLDWSLGPYAAVTTFEPESPVRLDVGLRLSARWEPRPGVVLSGVLRQPVAGNRDESDRTGTVSALPQVRTLSPEFARTDTLHVARLTADYLFRPGPSLYGRLTGGLLETQYGGVSAELLWKPALGPLALGVEVNRVRQRDFDMRFGFRDLDATTAFASAYYDHRGGYTSRLDVGRYLAGDVGATYSLTRRFGNGWEVGAFATKTDASAEAFGEGSFDKGLTLRVPLGALTGQSSREARGLTVRPIQRDGGARVDVASRLYGTVADQSGERLLEDWGRFWR